jgi:serine/threonine-protein kinase
MNACSTDQLKLLIRDQLNRNQTDQLRSHLSTCKNCQREIETLAADEEWWNRATKNLGQTSETFPNWPSGGDSIMVRVDSRTSNSVASPKSSSKSVLDPPAHPEMLGRIDGFEIEERIGQGGMGVVFRGFDSALNRPVAIKVLAPHLASSGIARKRFAREAQAAAAVVHPNVVPIYSVKDSPKRPYIVMALVDGRSLQDHVTDTGPLPVKEIVRIAHQIAAGLAEAHKQGLIHRDIKPANILLEKDVSRVMITDFGLARAADDVAMTQTGWLAGTPHYMSPEQAQGKDIDRRSDLFSLGSVIYFMATGREPFRAEKPLAILQKIDQHDPIPARNINSDVPKTLDRLIQGLLEKNPDNRIESSAKLERLLARYLAHLQHPQAIAKPSIRTAGTLKRQLRWASLSLLALSLLLAGYFAWPWLSTKNTPASNQPTSTIAKSEPAPITEPSDDWMKGLQSFDQWNSDATSLEQEIQDLESDFSQRWIPLENVPQAPPSVLPESEILDIENQLNELESQSKNRTP